VIVAAFACGLLVTAVVTMGVLSREECSLSMRQQGWRRGKKIERTTFAFPFAVNGQGVGARMRRAGCAKKRGGIAPASMDVPRLRVPDWGARRGAGQRGSYSRVSGSPRTTRRVSLSRASTNAIYTKSLTSLTVRALRTYRFVSPL
jgi:hypothetical protein